VSVKAQHIKDPADESRTLCGEDIPEGMEVTDIRDGLSWCTVCTSEADAWWAAEDATWD
jgi:hypothetical protein